MRGPVVSGAVTAGRFVHRERQHHLVARGGLSLTVTVSEPRTSVRTALLVPPTLARRLGLKVRRPFARVATGRRRLTGRRGSVRVQIPRGVASRLARVPARRLRGLRLEVTATSASGRAATSTRPLVLSR